MNSLALKLILAPLIIGSASLAGRKWGPAVSGWIVGMPITSGPVIFFVALANGTSFAAAASLGVLSGGISLVAYALTYSWLAIKFPWWVSLTGSLLVFFTSTTILQNITFPLWVAFVLVCIVLVVGLRLMPKHDAEQGESRLGVWDIPVRILIGTSFILLLTGIAPYIGSRLTGLLTTVPLYITILTIFAHRNQGPAAAAHTLHGLLHGLFAFVGFFIVLNLLLERTSLAVSFGAAILTTLVVQGLSLKSLVLKRFVT
jgi:hypothetical protein